MPTIKVPPVLRQHTDGEAEVSVEGSNVGEALRALIANRELRMNYANRAYHHALKQFNTDRMVDGYLDLYWALISTHAGVAA